MRRLRCGVCWLALFPAACDRGADTPSTEETIKQTIGSAVQDNLAGLKAHDEALAAQLTAIDERGTANAARLDQVLTKLEDLDAKLRALEPAARPTAPTAPPPAAGRPDPSVTYRVPLGDAHTRGPDTALVTIVTWSDFQCPFCSRVVPTLEALEKKYGDDVRVAFKHNPLPFHARALPAAIAAEAAGKQGKFWEMHDKLFANSKDLTDENFVAWAKAMRLDVPRFKKDLADPDLKDAVEAMQTEGNTLGARGTPAFFINGRFLSGAQPATAFETVIDQERTKAEALLASGVSRSDVYERTIAAGAHKPE